MKWLLPLSLFLQPCWKLPWNLTFLVLVIDTGHWHPPMKGLLPRFPHVPTVREGTQTVDPLARVTMLHLWANQWGNIVWKSSSSWNCWGREALARCVCVCGWVWVGVGVGERERERLCVCQYDNLKVRSTLRYLSVLQFHPCIPCIIHRLESSYCRYCLPSRLAVTSSMP